MTKSRWRCCRPISTRPVNRPNHGQALVDYPSPRRRVGSRGRLSFLPTLSGVYLHRNILALITHTTVTGDFAGEGAFDGADATGVVGHVDGMINIEYGRVADIPRNFTVGVFRYLGPRLAHPQRPSPRHNRGLRVAAPGRDPANLCYSTVSLLTESSPRQSFRHIQVGWQLPSPFVH